MQVTLDYVHRRFETFASKYAEALATLKYDEQVISLWVSQLRQRLAAHDFKLYGDKPINVLHGGKRITRFLIKSAILFSPAQRARVERLRADYIRKVKAERVLQPHAVFFGFEAAYAKHLSVPLTPYRRMFMV